MVTITLDERDRAVLEELRDGERDVESLAQRASCRPEYLSERLSDLADNGLVRRVDEDIYAITANGDRAMAGSPAGTMDNRIDTPDEVEDAIRSLDLRLDRREAVRNAFAFVHYWGETHESEIVDAVFSENPAGFESSEEWWNECVGEPLAGLPLVEAPRSSDSLWRYTETPIVEETTDDGRIASGGEMTERASAKSALYYSGLNGDERSAVRAAFDLLVREEQATAAEIKDQVYPGHDVGYDAADGWWIDCVRDGLRRIPGVDRVDDTRNVWRYCQSTEGPMSSSPGADVPHGLTDSEGESDG